MPRSTQKKNKTADLKCQAIYKRAKTEKHKVGRADSQAHSRTISKQTLRIFNSTLMPGSKI